ncbi:MAG: pyridoxal phosphate-dependent aminotransferase [Lachnospiraceae bacterium]|nr:pyridoxal phosphate-dependent aminotransferase [Lachnospiraceae bacterium]
MLSEKMLKLGTNRSVIRDLFEYGNKRKAEIGADKVFDFSLGNPSVPAPPAVKEAALDLLQNGDELLLHSYTSAQGDAGLRGKIAEYINEQHGTSLTADSLYITVGAAASLTISLKALTEDRDEFITFAPFFPEYRVFVENAGASLVVVNSDPQDFQIDCEAFEKAITSHTKGVILNSPNNPSGVVITEEGIQKVCDILEKKQKEYGHPIFLISDEPYRELVYDGVKVPYLMNYYDNTIVCYSYSKSLSLPGERIGYIAISDKAVEWKNIYAAVCGAGRSLGYVCAPSLFQQVVARCIGQTSDVSVYKKNRDLLYNALTEYGYRCIKPDGAFYLFVESLEEDATAFAEKAKEFELLIVPADSFGTPGFVRISYCVSTEQIENSLPAFQALAQAYQR